MSISAAVKGVDWRAALIEFATLGGFVSPASVEIDFYPDKPVTLLLDSNFRDSNEVGRLVAEKLGSALAQPFRLSTSNCPGILDDLRRCLRPDGYTLALSVCPVDVWPSGAESGLCIEVARSALPTGAGIVLYASAGTPLPIIDKLAAAWAATIGTGGTGNSTCLPILGWT